MNHQAAESSKSTVSWTPGRRMQPRSTVTYTHGRRSVYLNQKPSTSWQPWYLNHVRQSPEIVMNQVSGLVGRLDRLRHLIPCPLTWVWYAGLTWWKDKTNSWKFPLTFIHVQACIHTYTLKDTHTHIYMHTHIQNTCMHQYINKKELCLALFLISLKILWCQAIYP